MEISVAGGDGGERAPFVGSETALLARTPTPRTTYLPHHLRGRRIIEPHFANLSLPCGQVNGRLVCGAETLRGAWAERGDGGVVDVGDAAADGVVDDDIIPRRRRGGAAGARAGREIGIL